MMREGGTLKKIDRNLQHNIWIDFTEMQIYLLMRRRISELVHFMLKLVLDLGQRRTKGPRLPPITPGINAGSAGFLQPD